MAGRGGYEQWCQEVADGLTNRGHNVLVLTSTHGRDDVQNDQPWVRRELHLEMELASLRNAVQFFTSRKKREEENLALLRKTVQVFSPDAILVWGMWNFPRSLPVLAETLMPDKVVYYMGDYWPALPGQFENYWNASPRNIFTGLPKSLLKPIAQNLLMHEERPHLRLEHILFPSAFMQDEFERKGITPQKSKVIYGAIDTKSYLNGNVSTQKHDRLSLLYLGRLTHEKGVHTAIEALAQLVHEHGVKKIKLTIVGDGDQEYVTRLHTLVEEKFIASFVDFRPAQPKEILPALYHSTDILLFTSIWSEPFGRVIVEAMASGVLVIGTNVGGAGEILSDGKNALIFTPDNPSSLTKQIRRVIETPFLLKQLTESARETAINKFDIQRMTAEIETYLQAIITQ